MDKNPYPMVEQATGPPPPYSMFEQPSAPYPMTQHATAPYPTAQNQTVPYPMDQQPTAPYPIDSHANMPHYPMDQHANMPYYPMDTQKPTTPYPIVQQPLRPAAPNPHQQELTPAVPQDEIKVTPPGLECLVNLGILEVKQEVEIAEAVTGCETNNRYTVLNANNHHVYRIKENTNCCARNCCGKCRPFKMEVTGLDSNVIMRFSRSLACSSCWFPCCLQGLQVFSPPDNLIGSIQQTWSLFSPSFDIRDAEGKTILKLKGRCCQSFRCGDVPFDITSADGGQKVGKLCKKWSGVAQEALTDADNFRIEFPMDLDVNIKATIIGACILVDFMYFEDSESNGCKLCLLCNMICCCCCNKE